MKRGLFLLATVTLSSALYGQSILTREQAREVFAAYNPALLEAAAQNEPLNQLLEQLLSTYTGQNLPDTLENRYTLIALARNFENSLALNAALEQYQQALLYSQVGGNVQEAAYAHARRAVDGVYPRIWAVSVQVKEDLLKQYKTRRRALQADENLSAQDKKARLEEVDLSIQALQADLKQLNTNVGPQLVQLRNETLAEAQERVQQAVLQLRSAQEVKQTANLQVKTKHKKPVAG